MTAVLLVLSLLVFGAGVIAWAVHMHGVWRSETSPVPKSVSPPASATRTEITAEVMADPFAHVDEPPLKEVRP